jgi:hypothetical protein
MTPATRTLPAEFEAAAAAVLCAAHGSGARCYMGLRGA